MKKPGPKSAASMAVAPPAELDAVKQRPAPPEGLGKAESAIWRRIVAGMPAGWFSAEHHELLERYCEHQHRAERFSRVASKMAAADDLTRDDIDDVDKASRMAERESKTALALARALRMTITSQTRQENASTKRAGSSGITPPWWESDQG